MSKSSNYIRPESGDRPVTKRRFVDGWEVTKFGQQRVCTEMTKPWARCRVRGRQSYRVLGASDPMLPDPVVPAMPHPFGETRETEYLPDGV